jgi:hypothetical protein
MRQPGQRKTQALGKRQILVGEGHSIPILA